MRCSCATSHFCLGYGSLTTALSAGACDESKSSVCLGFGITGVVLGLSLCLCLGWDKYVHLMKALKAQATILLYYLSRYKRNMQWTKFGRYVQ